MTFRGGIPILETDRLVMRATTVGDFPAYAAMWGDANFVQFSGGTPLSEEDAWQKFLRYPGHWQLLGFGLWAVEEKLSRRFIGEVGFADQHRDIEPSIKGIPEVGWAIAPPVQGKGYAVESVQAAIQWGGTFFGHVRTACTIHPDNLASIRVAEKCGFREAARTTHKGNATVLFYRNL